jgi:phosphatidylethanolamine/phosphatidyl-N-methylethanolamine N-methyltransferase
LPEQTRSLRLQPDDRFAFFRGFLKRPKQVGSIIPSSRFLERRVTRATRAHRANLVVELGPGTGGTTRALLRAMQPEAQLLAIEINPHFVEVLQRWPEKRLIVAQGSALDIGSILAAHGLSAPDVIVSGIPFSTMTMPIGRDILRSVYDALEPGGAFVAYQVRDRVHTLGREVFGRARVQTELLNVPPMRIYRWEKHAATTPRSIAV